MKTTYVLDTNVLLFDPRSLFAFDEHDVVLPITVLEELDKFKSEPSEIGANARECSRLIEALRTNGRLSEGVSLGEEMGVLRVFAENVEFSFVGLKNGNDNLIVGVAHRLQETGTPVILVTKDTNLRLKADVFGVVAQDYKGKGEVDTEVGKVQEVEVSATDIDALYDVHLVDAPHMIVDGTCAVLRGPTGQGALVRRKGQHIHLVNDKVRPGGVKPRNSEQRLFVDALLDLSVDMVICAGVAGCGKTLLSMACGVHLIDAGKYDKILITKAIQPVGSDIGYVKGTKAEKMAEWVKPFFDNLDFIVKAKGSRRAPDDEIQDWTEGVLEVEAITYIRGRSLMNKFIIVDEVQNLSPKIVKTLVSRVADSSKLVLLGDLGQIDSPYLGRRSNGLAYAMNHLGNLSNVAILNMVKSERGRLATLAVNKL